MLSFYNLSDDWLFLLKVVEIRAYCVSLELGSLSTHSDTVQVMCQLLRSSSSSLTQQFVINPRLVVKYIATVRNLLWSSSSLCFS